MSVIAAPTRLKLTSDQYRLMGERGILPPGLRVELIDGEIVEMAPIGPPHAGILNGLIDLLAVMCDGHAVLSPQHPVELDRFNEPQPDLCLLHWRESFYTDRHPTAADVVLLVEISDSTLRYDRSTKLALYARSGVQAYWIIDVQDRSIAAFGEPSGEGYLSERRALRGGLPERAASPSGRAHRARRARLRTGAPRARSRRGLRALTGGDRALSREPRIRLRGVEAFVFRSPIDAPVRTSFGVMTDRPAVLVRVADEDGLHGWGEVWCNFPGVGAEHRARLVRSVLAPLAEKRSFDSPTALFAQLSERTAVLAIQSGEPGPIAQCIAGLDIAAWDIVSRRQAVPLWRLLGGETDRIEVYASGLNPDQPAALAAARRDEGHRRFKLKVGFGRKRDLTNLAELRAALGPDTTLMVDANQAWELEDAAAMLPALQAFDLAWLEEPLRADRPWAQWLRLRELSRIPLAAGENIAGEAAFAQAIATGALAVVQPDIAKWGGFSGCLPVARAILAAGLRYCPHYLGGGLGLLASAHLLAAVGGDGLLEIDANPNPLRTRLCGSLSDIRDGHARLGSAPGLGVEPDLDALDPWRCPF